MIIVEEKKAGEKATAALEGGKPMTNTLIVDPPSGWKYGFPKAVPDDRRHDIIAWIVEQGYPRDIIDEWVEGHFPLRCWYEEKGECLARKEKACDADA